MNMLTKFGVKERKLVVQTCSNMVLVREGFGAFWWTKMTLIDMSLCKIITICICDLLEFSWILMKIFPVEIFQILEMGRNDFGRFCPIFNHLHVLKHIYMGTICPLSLPNLSQMFLKHLNNLALRKSL